MKRKSNIFYNTTNDSRFITFSNYAESLTGNFLSTNSKVFPSAFICLHSPRLAVSTVNEFNNQKNTLLNIIMSCYENKIAFLRDQYNKTNKVPGDEFKLLTYLFEALYKFDNNITIEYVDNITEEDYNGTFTDTICVVDIADFKTGYLERRWPTATHKYPYTDYNKYLYGWYDTIINESGIPTYKYIGPSMYENLSPLFDGTDSGTPYYMIDPQYSDVIIKQGTSNEYLKFNLILPLYDVFLTDDYTIDTTIDIKTGESLVGTYTRNVPMGLWFSGLYPIELRRNGATNYAPSWSLVIGSQFKPFPYSSKMPSEITRTAKEDAFYTFAQVLTRQNAILDKFEELNTRISDLSTEIQSIESRISTMGTQTNIDELRIEIEKIKKQLNN